MKNEKMRELTIFLIEADNDSRRLFRECLKHNGYKVSLAIDEEDALERVGGEYLKADSVLINLPGKSPDEVLEVGRRICRAGNLNAPLVVIAGKYASHLEGTNAQIGEKEYIVYLEDGEQLFDLLSRIVKIEI
ncbi:MAG: hypothetical protein ACR2LT_09415 [Pyrinomonadaceae bacterium]